MDIKNNKYYKTYLLFSNLQQTLRIFPYIGYLLTFFPFIAVLISNGVANTPYIFLLLVPFIPAMAAGFIYNTISDADKDPAGKNPITNKSFTKKAASYSLVISVAISLVLFVLFYTSIFSILLSILYLFFWLAYSGLRIRFKENLSAPLVAAFVLWVGGPIILLVQFNYNSLVTNLLLLGLFLTSIGFEINHTIGDYDVDLKYNCKTFAVRAGLKNAVLIKHISIAFGYTILLISAYYMNISNLFILIFLPLFLISQSFMILLEKNDLDLSKKVFHGDFFFISPFFLIRLFMVVFGLAVLAFSPVYLLLFLWLYFTDKRSFSI